MNIMPELMIGIEDLPALKKLYAESEGREIFMYKGHEVLRAYAKYLIEYLESLK